MASGIRGLTPSLIVIDDDGLVPAARTVQLYPRRGRWTEDQHRRIEEIVDALEGTVIGAPYNDIVYCAFQPHVDMSAVSAVLLSFSQIRVNY